MAVVGVWLIGAVISVALAAAVAALAWGGSDYKTIDYREDGYSKVVAEGHSIEFMPVFFWASVVALATWTILYLGYRLMES